ncbi:MAG: hypothetical protein WAV29_04360 [Microgenomates group bacterium]
MNMQLYCPRCEGDLVKATYHDYFNDVTLKRAHTWYAKSIYIILNFLQGDYYYGFPRGPGMLKCVNCGYYVENIPSTYFKPGSVMVPKAIPEFKKVKTSTSFIVIFLMVALCIGLIILNNQLR